MEKAEKRANILLAMNEYIMEYCNDEELLDYWFTYGVADCEDKESLMEADKDCFIEICEAFEKMFIWMQED